MAYFFWWPGQESTQTIYTLSKILQFTWPLMAWWLLRLPHLFKPTFWSTENSHVERRSGWPVAIMAALITLFLGTLAYHYYFADLLNVPDVRDAILKKLSEFGVHNVVGFVALGFFIAVVHSFLEEYYWRGYVMREWQTVFMRTANSMSVKAALPSALPIIFSALAFTLHHTVVIANYAQMARPLPIIIFASLVVFAFGVFWSWHYSKYRSLAAVWVSHIAADLVMLWIGYNIVYGLN